MAFLQDYLKFNQGNECPENFHLWSALALLSTVVSRKVHIQFGDQRVYPNIYVCLIGRQGSRKSTAKDVARDILEEEFPDIPRAASITTKEGILKYLGSDESIRTYDDDKGVITEYHPMALFVNELKNFLSVNPQGMLDFLTDIYDRKYFDTGFKNAGTDIIPNPYLVLLACETDDWFVEKLKTAIVSGGFARRIIPVYEKDKRCSIARPFIDAEMLSAKKRIIATLKKIEPIVGTFTWEPDAIKFHDDWYESLETPKDRMMEGYYSSKHTQLQKIAMLLTMADYGDLVIRKCVLEYCLALLDVIEKGMKNLYRAGGKNPLILPTVRLMDELREIGGKMPQKEFMKLAYQDMTPIEVDQVITYLTKTKQIAMNMDKDGKTVRPFIYIPTMHQVTGIAKSPEDASPDGA